MPRTLLLRAGAAVLAAAAAALVLPAPVSAHVTVSSASAVQGGYGKVTFRVPNEKPNAGTVKLEVNLPVDKPVASVGVKPVPGWTAVTEKSKLATPLKVHDSEVTEAITKITWTADASSPIKPGEFQEFDVSLGPLPQADQLVFKALQTYSDGDVVRWIDEPAAGAEAEHPAPVLKLAKAATGDTHAAAATTAAAQDAAATMKDGEKDSDGTAIGIGIAGLVLGLAGLVAGVLAYRRAGRTA